MLLLKIIGITSLVLVSTLFSSVDTFTQLKGVTYHAEKNTLAYTETRKRSFKNEKIHKADVWYITQGKDTLAYKDLDYSKSLFRPDIDFSQYKLDYRLKVRTLGNRVSVDYKEGNKEMKKTFSVPADAIMDGGIRNYIIANIENLKKKKKLEFPLVVPERADFYYFTVTLVEEVGSKRIKMVMKPSSWLLAMLAPQMELYYDIQKKELITYRGISDIKHKNGKNMNVFIRYN